MKKIFFSIAFALAGLILIYFIMRTISIALSPIKFSEMDWDQDGNVTLGEFFEASDVGFRDIEISGEKCTEYYALKDAKVIKTVCGKRG